MLTTVFSLLVLAQQGTVATLRPDYPASDTPVTVSALRSNDVLAIVRPVRHDHDASRLVLSGRLPDRWSAETVQVLAASDPALPRVLRIITPTVGGDESTIALGIRRSVQTGLVSVPRPERSPDTGATFLLVARRAQKGRLSFNAPWTHTKANAQLVGDLRAEGDDEVAGYLLVRSDAKAVDTDPDLIHALLRTLVKGLDQNSDEECVRQAASLVVRSRGGGNGDAAEAAWFSSAGRPLLREAANRRRGLERLLLESAWQVSLDLTPWSSTALVQSVEDLVSSGRSLDPDDESLLRRLMLGQVGVPFVRTATLAQRTPQDWLRAKLIDALPEPGGESEYNLALGLANDPSDRVLMALATRLSQWGGRPDLTPIRAGMMRTPHSAELRSLLNGWGKVPFSKLKRSQDLIPVRNVP